MKKSKLILFAVSFLFQSKVYQQIESVDVPVSRGSRATNAEFSNIIDKLSVSSRLITAISLQNGLIDKSIPADKVILELLNVDSSVKLESFDKGKVDAFTKSINTLGGTIKASNEQISIENMIPILNSWRRKFEEVGDLNHLKLSSEYFSEIDKLKAVTIDKSFIDPVMKSINETIPHLEKLKDLPSDTRQNDKDNVIYAGQLAQLGKSLQGAEDVLTKIPELLNAMTQLNTLKPLKFPIDSPQKKFIDLMKYYFLTQNNVQSAGSIQIDELVADITAVAAVDTDASSVDIGTLKSISFSRTSFDFTSGFLGGSSDLKKIPTDSQDQWFSDTSGISVEKLKAGLVSLNELDAKITVVEDSWKVLQESVENQNNVERIVGVHEKIRAIKEASKNSKASIQNIASSISRPSDNSDFTIATRKVFQDSNTLLDVMTTITPLITSLSQSSIFQELSEITKLKDLVAFKNPVNDQIKEVPDIIDRIKAYQKTEDLMKAMKEVGPILEKINNQFGTDDLNKIIADLGQGKSAIEAFVKDPATKRFIDFFKPFGSLATESEYESLRTSVELVRGVRDLKNVDLAAVTSAVEQSLPAIKDLMAFPGTLKSQPDLEKLKDLGKDSKTFGDAVKALDNVRKVLEKKDDIEKFLDDAGSVEAEILKITDMSVRRELLDDWGDFEEVRRAVFELLIDLEAKRDKIQATRRQRATSGFTDYQSVFTEFQGLPDVNWNTEKLQKVLGTLAPSSQNMKDLKASLDSLGSLNLKFASSNQPLGQIVATLANLQKTFSSKSGGSGGSDDSEGPTLTDQSDSLAHSTISTAPDFLSTTSGTIVVICGVLFVAFSLVAVNMYCIFVKYKRKPAK